MRELLADIRMMVTLLSCVFPEAEHLGEELGDDVHGLAPEEHLGGGGAFPHRPRFRHLPVPLDQGKRVKVDCETFSFKGIP